MNRRTLIGFCLIATAIGMCTVTLYLLSPPTARVPPSKLVELKAMLVNGHLAELTNTTWWLSSSSSTSAHYNFIRLNPISTNLSDVYSIVTRDPYTGNWTKGDFVYAVFDVPAGFSLNVTKTYAVNSRVVSYTNADINYDGVEELVWKVDLSNLIHPISGYPLVVVYGVLIPCISGV